MTKRWVFEAIVQEKGNVEHLIAYAIYKSNKYELACTKRKEGATQAQIDEALQTFHDNLLSTHGQQQQCRDAARTALDAFTAELEERIRDNYEKQIVKLEKTKNKEIENAKRTAKNEFVRKVHQETLDSLPLRAIKWIWNGFAGVFAGLILAVLVAATLFFFTPESQKEQARQSLAQFLIGGLEVSTPEPNQAGNN